MNDDINRALDVLSRQPVPQALARIDATVLERIAELGPRLREIPTRYAAGMAVAALAMGIVGGALPGRATAPEPALYPLTSAHLTPSSLLSE
ncbi:hypothetical protein RCO27_14285 [Sphingosinicella sp. LHD-64]|uniref:hypothetical protein n=1 Tax=Sphingosinicella sp. LHD-64 TaxID=3072139 RepID=UPI00280F9023|nr:hypothetical protein [Sphingosinicella sp. LHD-64]MDQ8757395.1 hypothetical protein [Sphingosinicella sp. LHD-64]